MASPRVLIVDDDAGVRDVLGALVESAGYRVEAADGPGGLELVGRWRPDVIVLDLLMPHVSGFEFLGRLHELTGGAPPPVIVLSALADDLSPALASGGARMLWVTKVLRKPCDAGELVQAIEEAYSRRS